MYWNLFNVRPEKYVPTGKLKMPFCRKPEHDLSCYVALQIHDDYFMNVGRINKIRAKKRMYNLSKTAFTFKRTYKIINSSGNVTSTLIQRSGIFIIQVYQIR